MKFKKIEISAFRIYNKPEDAIFDFSTKSDETADFISLYAPNGFGKTSFYDAVEWGVTASVNRFFIRNKELEKLTNNQSSKNNIPLLRNSKLEYNTYVKIYSDSNQLLFDRNISKDSKKTDLALKRDAEPHEFHKVILSQEWISAFLTESRGDERYTKFMENPELSEINNYYLNLKHLLSVYDAEVKQVTSDIKELEKIIKKIQDENLLETINNQINRLIDVYKENNLQIIKIATTDNELIKFKNLVAEKIIYFNNNKDLFTKTIDLLRIAKTGNDELLSMNAFGDSKTSLASLILEKEEIGRLLNKFDEYDKLGNEINYKREILKELSSKKDALDIILTKYSQFETIKKETKLKENLRLEIENGLPGLTIAIEGLKREEISLNEQLKTCLQQFEINEEKKRLLPSLQKSFDDINKAISETEKSILEQNPNIESLEKEIIKLQNQIEDYKTSIIQINEAKYSIRELEENTELIKLVAELNRTHSNLHVEREKLKLLNHKIEQQQVLNSTIYSFIEQGLAIVNERQSSNCPLCEQQYSDFNALAKRISSNKALNAVLQDLFNQKQNLNELLASLDERITTGNQKIIVYYDNKIKALNIEIIKETEKKQFYEKIIKEEADKLDSLKSKRAEIATSMSGMSFIEYEKQLVDFEIANSILKKKLTGDLSICQDNLKVKIEENEKAKSQISLLNHEKVELSKDIDYIAVIDYFKENYPSENISKDSIDKSLNDLKQNNLRIYEEIKNLEVLIPPLNTELSKHNKENLKFQDLELEKRKASLEKNINSFVIFLKENFEINADDADINQISEIIANKEFENKIELDKCKSIVDEYIKLEKNSEHIVDFLQTERAKIQLRDKEEELSFLETSVRLEIENERKRTKEYLEEKIKDFFFEDLINKLYQKIDPHPDFKEVKFISNLDVDPPRLDVFVKNEGSEIIIPNLYFSTAQINILSLSIFLASALKSKEYDCIFIDDPIQSMDSINVLSTIDLLRSIVVNNHKQIILSTHDENFHKLLQKKMPERLFKSKFLELESFGKIKMDA